MRRRIKKYSNNIGGTKIDMFFLNIILYILYINDFKSHII